MTNHSSNDRIQIFKSLFKGREDVFAIRWEKGNKAGYMPAYFFDPYMQDYKSLLFETFINISFLIKNVLFFEKA
jgi:hypothetical protein